jgi:hypothetical protein
VDKLSLEISENVYKVLLKVMKVEDEANASETALTPQKKW